MSLQGCAKGRREEIPEYARYYLGGHRFEFVFVELGQWTQLARDCRRDFAERCTVVSERLQGEMVSTLDFVKGHRMFGPLMPPEHFASIEEHENQIRAARQRFMGDLFAFDKELLSEQLAVESVCADGSLSPKILAYRDFDLTRFWKVSEVERDISSNDIESGADTLAAELTNGLLSNRCSDMIRFGRGLLNILHAKLLPYRDENWPDLTEEDRSLQSMRFVQDVARSFETEIAR